MFRIISILLLMIGSVHAQTNMEQLYRNMNSALAQDNARLGAEIIQLQKQIQDLQKKPEEQKGLSIPNIQKLK